MGAYESDWGHSSLFEPVGGEIAVVGIGEAEHSKASGRTTHEIAAQAIELARFDVISRQANEIARERILLFVRNTTQMTFG